MKLLHRKPLFAKLLLSLLTLVVALMLIETGHFAVVTVGRGLGGNKEISLFEWCGDCPEVYRLNPVHPEVDSLGFRNCRDDDISPEELSGAFHGLMILGDSVTYGYGVSCVEAYPHQLAIALESFNFKVFNGGVDGYGTYNEVQQYLQRGRSLNPEVVVLALVLNDVASPRLHWAEGGKNPVNVPVAAIPNPEYDRQHAIPVLAQWKREQFWRRFFLVRAMSRLLQASPRTVPSLTGDSTWPVHITGEDDLPLTVLLDSRSPESEWLKRMLGWLKTAVTDDGAELVVMLLPLAYQLEPDYPFVPQQNISDMCREIGVPSLDLLPAFRAHGGKPLFLDRSEGFEDIWHLSPEGHLVTARALEKFLRESSFLDGGIETGSR